jgi:hypothetical protein
VRNGFGAGADDIGSTVEICSVVDPLPVRLAEDPEF